MESLSILFFPVTNILKLTSDKLANLTNEFSSSGVHINLIIPESYPEEIRSHILPLLDEKSNPSSGCRISKSLPDNCNGYTMMLDPAACALTQTALFLWKNRNPQSVVILNHNLMAVNASAEFPRKVKLLSSILSLPLADFFSPFRIFPNRIAHYHDFSVSSPDYLISSLVLTIIQGFHIKDLPAENVTQESCLRSYTGLLPSIRSIYRHWLLRNSIAAADYDHRAFYSNIPMQRYWQRKRYEIILGFIGNAKDSILDIGCGSSNIIQSFHHGIALDVALNKLRFLERTNPYRVLASTFALPFADNSFQLLIHSQVIEHLPREDKIFEEITRVLKPGGTLYLARRITAKSGGLSPSFFMAYYCQMLMLMNTFRTILMSD